MDKYDTVEYSWVKATIVFVRLRISLFALTITNKLSGAVAREAIGVKILILTMMPTNLVYH
jgi:hypothetical protein